MENTKKFADSAQYIVISMGDEQFGIDIKYVDNIVRMQHITRVPKMPPYLNGVINLRGEVIPVMSLRLKFEFDEDVITGNTRILILKPDAHSSVGIIVDSVKEVLTLGNDMIDKVARDANDERAAYLSGVGKHGDSLISILNIVGMFADKEDENA